MSFSVNDKMAIDKYANKRQVEKTRIDNILRNIPESIHVYNTAMDDYYGGSVALKFPPESEPVPEILQLETDIIIPTIDNLGHGDPINADEESFVFVPEAVPPKIIQPFIDKGFYVDEVHGHILGSDKPEYSYHVHLEGDVPRTSIKSRINDIYTARSTAIKNAMSATK